MDVILIGFNVWDLYLFNERLSVFLIEKVYKFLIKVFENLD